MFITRECLFLFYNDTDTEKFRIHSLYIEKKKKNIKGETCFTLNHLFQHG